MNQAAPPPSLSTAPGSSSLETRSVATSPPVQESSPNSRQPHSDSGVEDMPGPTTMTEPEVPIAPASGHTVEHTTKRALKRSRTDSADEETSPVFKEARSPRVEVITSVFRPPIKTQEPTMLITNEDEQSVSEGDESPARSGIQTTVVPAKPEVPIKKSKAKPKTAPKKPIATSGRHRACDTCKRRKVKCLHNLAEKDGDDNSNLKETSSKRPTAKTMKGKNPTGLNERDESANLEASVQKPKAQKASQVGSVDSHDEEAEEPPKRIKAKKKAAPKKATALSERASTRNRNAPERFGNVEEQQAAKAYPVKKSVSKVFDPVYITTNSTSRLGKADMYRMLLSDAAWASLSAEQQMTLVSMLPDTPEHQQLIARIKAGETEHTRPWAFTLSNDCFRTDVAKFKEDLKNGHLAKTWQAAAEQAVIERAAGEYDAWKAEEAELWWGQKGK